MNVSVCYLYHMLCPPPVLYPITIGDFVLADMTDSALDGVVTTSVDWTRGKGRL